MGGIDTDSHFDNDYHLDKELLVWVVHAKYIKNMVVIVASIFNYAIIKSSGS